MKKLISLLLALTLLAALVGCTPKQAATQPTTVPTEPTVVTTEETTTEQTEPLGEPSSPVLYKATDDQGHTVYMLGSIHIGMDVMYPLPSYVVDAYYASDALAVELDITTADLAGAFDTAKYMSLSEGTIADYISEDLYEDAVKILKKNDMYVSSLDYYKPVMWYSMIGSLANEKAGADSERGIDMYFLNLANEEDKPIYEVESAEFQTQLLGELSMELQEFLLEGAVASYDTAGSNISTRLMCKAWATGNEDGILTMSAGDTTGLSAKEKKLMKEFDTALEGSRNVNMTEYAEEALLSGETVFIVVGAAHVFGEDGMAKGLEKLGYTVERIQE